MFFPDNFLWTAELFVTRLVFFQLPLQPKLLRNKELRSNMFREVQRMFPPFMGGRRVAKKVMACGVEPASVCMAAMWLRVSSLCVVVSVQLCHCVTVSFFFLLLCPRICLFVYARSRARVFVCVCVRACVRLCARARACVCARVCLFISVWDWVSVYLCVCVWLGRTDRAKSWNEYIPVVCEHIQLYRLSMISEP